MTRPATLFIMLTLLLVGGCRQKMAEAPRYDEYEPSPFFRDSLSVRPIPEGAVSRSGVQFGDQAPLLVGTDTTAGPAGSALPFPVTRAVLERGRHQYDIYCSPCHSQDGYGDGMIVQRGLQPPPSFHTERLRNAPIDHFYRVMTDGYGAMYSYASRVSPDDRWAIAAYIRALQLSQHAPIELLPSETRQQLESGAP